MRYKLYRIAWSCSIISLKKAFEIFFFMLWITSTNCLLKRLRGIFKTFFRVPSSMVLSASSSCFSATSPHSTNQPSLGATTYPSHPCPAPPCAPAPPTCLSAGILASNPQTELRELAECWSIQLCCREEVIRIYRWHSSLDSLLIRPNHLHHLCKCLKLLLNSSNAGHNLNIQYMFTDYHTWCYSYF